MQTMIKDPQIEEAVAAVCRLMTISAVTAPKAKGENFVTVKTLTGEVLQALADEMNAYSANAGKSVFARDGRNVANSDAVLLLGLKNANTCGLNCGACGYDLCDEFLGAPSTADGEFRGPFCAYRLIDLGIALGSAVKTAGMLNVDNRIMYRIGVAARRLGLVDWEFVIGVPLSVSGKSIYYDR